MGGGGKESAFKDPRIFFSGTALKTTTKKSLNSQTSTSTKNRSNIPQMAFQF